MVSLQSWGEFHMTGPVLPRIISPNGEVNLIYRLLIHPNQLYNRSFVGPNAAKRMDKF